MQINFFVIIKNFFLNFLNFFHKFLNNLKFLKNTFKVVSQYLFNIFILINIVFNLKFNFKLKIDQKCILLKTWKKFRKSGKNFGKMSGNPVKLYYREHFHFFFQRIGSGSQKICAHLCLEVLSVYNVADQSFFMQTCDINFLHEPKKITIQSLKYKL